MQHKKLLQDIQQLEICNMRQKVENEKLTNALRATKHQLDVTIRASVNSVSREAHDALCGKYRDLLNNYTALLQQTNAQDLPLNNKDNDLLKLHNLISSESLFDTYKNNGQESYYNEDHLKNLEMPEIKIEKGVWYV